jgi:ribonuclease P protein component
MRKLYIVKTTREFEDIIKNGSCKKNKYYVIHHKSNNMPYDRYGISVSKKLGNSVFRNKYKRKIRSIIDNYKKLYINKEDYIIILRKEAINKPYIELEKEFFNLMNLRQERKQRNEEQFQKN